MSELKINYFKQIRIEGVDGMGTGTSTDNIDAQTNSILDFWNKYQKNEIKIEVNYENVRLNLRLM